MDNQHRQIKGYRDLSQQEIDLMNEIKIKGAELGELVDKVNGHLRAQKAAAEGAANGITQDVEEAVRIASAEPGRWASIGRTHFQEGLMAMTRAVAQPTFF